MAMPKGTTPKGKSKPIRKAGTTGRKSKTPRAKSK